MRIVSLCPSLTELVYELGRGEALVGRTKFCTHPPGLVDRVEIVGGTKNPRIPRVLALQPDWVLLNEEENRREDAQALRDAGLRCHVSFPRTVAETSRMVRSIGVALERLDAADRLAEQIDDRAAQVREAWEARPPQRYVYLIWRAPWMTINRDTFVHSMLGLAGGENVFGGRPDRYPSVRADEIAAADPHCVLLSSEPFPFREGHADELAEKTGLPRERFRLVDGELLSWHGPRTPAGIDYAARVLREI